MIQFYGGIFTIPVLSFQTTLACVKVTETTQHKQSLSVAQGNLQLRSFTKSPACPAICYSCFYLVTVAHLSNFKYL